MITCAFHNIAEIETNLWEAAQMDYDCFDNKLLEILLRCFDSQALRNATGDVFGRS
jgi:type I restriction enzyme M protein